MKIQFFAGDGFNYLYGEDEQIKVNASVQIVDDCSEDYGYLSLKAALLQTAKANGICTDDWEFQYDGQELYLTNDAKAECAVEVEIITEDAYILNLERAKKYGLL